MQLYDGSYGEGGGGILRLVTSIALLKQEPVKVINIRKKRSKPGLQTQHLIGLRTLAELCGGELEGDYLGSETIKFNPAESWKSDLTVQVPTAGSIALILQSLQIGILGLKDHLLNIKFEGGATFGKWAPSIPYIDKITWDIFRQMNYELKITTLRHGFFPKGGAIVKAMIKSPKKLLGLNLSSYHPPKDANILSFASKHLLKAKVAERQSKKIIEILREKGIETQALNEYVDANNPGSGILIYSKIDSASRIGGDFVGERKLSAEKVGLNALDRYLLPILNDCTVDPYLADQILPVMALASSSSEYITPFLSKHTQTNVSLLKKILDIEINVEKRDSRFIISVDI